MPAVNGRHLDYNVKKTIDSTGEERTAVQDPMMTKCSRQPVDAVIFLNEMCRQGCLIG